MDPELKTLLSALVEGQIKLADSDETLRTEMARGHDELRREMARGHGETQRRLAKLETTTTRVLRRLDWFGEQIVRGFTHSVAADNALDRRLTRLERQFSAFKRSRRRPKKH